MPRRSKPQPTPRPVAPPGPSPLKAQAMLAAFFEDGPVDEELAMGIGAMKHEFQPCGGHLFNPPERCEYKKVSGDGGIWTDHGCCLACCQDVCKKFFASIKPSDKKQIIDYKLKQKARLPS